MTFVSTFWDSYEPQLKGLSGERYKRYKEEKNDILDSKTVDLQLANSMPWQEVLLLWTHKDSMILLNINTARRALNY